MLLENMITEKEEKEQILRIIKQFEKKRPENLLQFQKAFLQLNTGYNYRLKCQMQARVCSATLAKYVFEKWRNVMPKLRESRKQEQAAF